MPPDAMAAVEDVAVLLSLLAIDRIIEPALRSCDIAFRPLRKMGVGFLLCAASFACAASLESAITRSDVKVSIAWQVPQVVLLGISEALVATAALAFGYEVNIKIFVSI
jgi:dipeptide/tripeptide permease